MKPAAAAFLFAVFSVVALASGAVDGEWIAGAIEEDGDIPPMIVTLTTGEEGALSGFMDYAYTRLTIRSGAVNGSSVTFEAVREVEGGGTVPGMSCTGAAAEGVIDLTCQIAGGAVKRFMLSPRIG